MDRKKAIRIKVLERRNSLSYEDRSRYDNVIYHKLLKEPEFCKADTVLLYMSYRSEVSTKEILNYCLMKKKKVFCPRVLSDTRMEFYWVSCLEDLKKGYQGIPEPISETLFSMDKKAVMILPLAGFDHERNRLGYGKGYYDRFLQGTKNIYKIGIAYECQKWEELLPMEESDVPLDLIITELSMYGKQEKVKC